MHRAERLAEADRRRPSARQRGYTSEWERERAAWLEEHPWCAECGAPATEVHHSLPHRGNPAIFWNRSKWVSLCRAHHSAATMREVNQRRRAC
jgi:5-methylcytosine-specific restriction enzyme A